MAELNQGKFLNPNLEKKAQLVDARRSRLSAQSPLVTYLGQMSSSLGNLAAALARSSVGHGLDQHQGQTGDRTSAASAERNAGTASGNWIALLQNRDRKDAAELNAVTSTRSGSPPRSGPTSETKAKSLLAVGLAQRNHGKIRGSEKDVEAAELAATRAKVARGGAGQNGAAGVNEPEAYYLPLAWSRFQVEGKKKEALQNWTPVCRRCRQCSFAGSAGSAAPGEFPKASCPTKPSS